MYEVMNESAWAISTATPSSSRLLPESLLSKEMADKSEWMCMGYFYGSTIFQSPLTEVPVASQWSPSQAKVGDCMNEQKIE